jgi:hypothetical protein
MLGAETAQDIFQKKQHRISDGVIKLLREAERGNSLERASSERPTGKQAS